MLPIIVACLLLAEVERSSGSNTSCAPVSCGNLTIRYPFSLAGAQPLYCGYPPFDLVCDAYGRGHAQAYLSNTFREHVFRIANISYTNNFLVAAFASNGSCPVPDFDVSSSLALFPFTISGANMRLVFFYRCAVPPGLLLPRPCGNRTMGAYISGRWEDGQGGATLPRGVSKSCMSVSVPVRAGTDPARPDDYERLIADGFLLELVRPLGDCDACRRMRGECRFDQLSFQCVCPDGKLCRSSKSNQSNSTTHSVPDCHSS